jgi:hypothetical protein
MTGEVVPIRSTPGIPEAMAAYEVTWNDERGQQTLEADDVVLEDGIYEFWRGDDVFLRVPSTDIKELTPAAES